VGFLDTALGDMQNGINVLIPLIITYGLPIFASIALLAFAVAAVMSMVRRDLGAILDSLSYTIMLIAFGEWAFGSAVTWMTAVQDTFIEYGERLTGQSPATLTPTGIILEGLNIANQLFHAAALRGWFFISMAQVEAFIAGAFVFLAFLGVAIMLLLCELALTAVIVIGSIVLIFSVLPWVLPSLQAYGLAVLSLGMKLITLFCVVALGLIEAASWSHDLAALGTAITKDIHNILLVSAEAILFVIAAYYLPNLISSLVSGGVGPTFGLGEAFLAKAGAEGTAHARSGAQQAAVAGIGAASSAAGTAAGTAARAVRNMLLSS
jgi:P-type conjugative transfer protein TrbL